MRIAPIGRDKLGNAYWFQVDPEANMRIYREDYDEETWELVADTRDQLEELVTKLTEGDTYTRTQSQDMEDMEEDSMQGFDDVIRDTGTVESGDVTSADISRYNSEDEDTRSSWTGGRATPDRLKIKGVPLKKRGLSESPVDFNRKADTESESKRLKMVVGEEVTDNGYVEGRGEGEANNAANIIEGEEICDTFVVIGRGSGAECDARNGRANGVAVARNGRGRGSEDDDDEDGDGGDDDDEDDDDDTDGDDG